MSSVKLQHSIATRLLKIIFGLYLVVTIVLTGLQMYTEYQLTSDTIQNEIEQLPETYGPGLGTALWTFNDRALHSQLVGMQQISTVSGVKIKYENETRAIGIIEDDNGEYREYSKNELPLDNSDNQLLQSLIKYEFPITYTDKNGKIINVGSGIIYTSTGVVFSRVKDGFVLLIITAILKTLALWVIFIYFIRRLLAQPLQQLAQASQTIDLNNLESSHVKLKSAKDDELHILEQSFNQMLDTLGTSKKVLDEYHEQLESMVEARTRNLQSEIEIRKQAQKTAEKANAMKDMFIANISHEIRTPMTSVFGMTSILRENETDKDKRDKLELVERNCLRLLTIINEILDFSKIQSDTATVEVKPFNINECVSTVINSLQPLTNEKNIQLNFNNHNIPDVIASDSLKISQILTNIVGNAIKFTEQGSITIDIMPEPHDQDLVQFNITDTGIGIAKDQQESLFDAFTQVDGSSSRQHGGTGLGLAVSQKYVEKLGGRIWVTSEPGKGSTFSFVIPAIKDTNRIPKSKT